jgi:delta8-fatty-acid desaturase
MMVARFNLYALGLKYLFESTNKQNARYRQTEILCICGIFPVWYGWVAWHLPTRGTMMAWIFLSHAVTMLLHLQIVVSHWSMETYRTKQQQQQHQQPGDDDSKNNKSASSNQIKHITADDWYMLQCRTTMDIACPEWLDWLHIGLQFQTVHHLYPTLPRPRLRAATTRVKDVCAQHKIPFAEMPFLPMVADSLRVLRETAALARSGQYTRNHLGEALRAEG